MNKNKNLISRIWYGIKSGWSLPIYPEHIVKLENNLYVKIFKVIGGICLFSVISGISQQLNIINFMR